MIHKPQCVLAAHVTNDEWRSWYKRAEDLLLLGVGENEFVQQTCQVSRIKNERHTFQVNLKHTRMDAQISCTAHIKYAALRYSEHYANITHSHYTVTDDPVFSDIILLRRVIQSPIDMTHDHQ